MDPLRYTVILEPADEGGFVVTVPALPGCFTQGETYEEAIAMAQDAIQLWIEELRQHGGPIPSDEAGAGVRVETIEVHA